MMGEGCGFGHRAGKSAEKLEGLGKQFNIGK